MRTRETDRLEELREIRNSLDVLRVRFNILLVCVGLLVGDAISR